ncbi:High-affinity branched-chain amino acid transport system permease protein LivH [Methylobacterium crusticola]|uniref:High-affinity branched-chain amino acid transport system permease protein LivH n=1 Tax=Methylobacterium crusticola TaxID=1697972 RepID=A0ABQ4R8J5_9HYPH|nr:branched-chain amino acid ABC transporter permease [Methylobacterium crusticola]GJD53717.1 High-affinity branched-chain amino acid transport system permease protein LivH [Methylobacterium crusticola]
MTAQILDVLTTAAMLFIVCLGLQIVYGVMRIINFAHAAFLTIGGYSALVAAQLGLNPWLALPFAGLVGLVLGALVERLIVRPLYARPLDAILATWGLGIVIGQLVTIGFGREVQFVPSPVQGTVEVAGATYSLYRLLLVLGAGLLGLAVAALLSGTRFGLVTRAVIMNESLAEGLGINSGLVRFACFSVGAGLASLAGAAITPLSSVDPNMGVPWLVGAFMLVMVSGASLRSLALATLLLGGAQVLISAYASPVLGGLTIVVLAAVILRLRPKGLALD